MHRTRHEFTVFAPVDGTRQLMLRLQKKHRSRDVPMRYRYLGKVTTKHIERLRLGSEHPPTRGNPKTNRMLAKPSKRAYKKAKLEHKSCKSHAEPDAAWTGASAAKPAEIYHNDAKTSRTSNDRQCQGIIDECKGTPSRKTS